MVCESDNVVPCLCCIDLDSLLNRVQSPPFFSLNLYIIVLIPHSIHNTTIYQTFKWQKKASLKTALLDSPWTRCVASSNLKKRSDVWSANKLLVSTARTRTHYKVTTPHTSSKSKETWSLPMLQSKLVNRKRQTLCGARCSKTTQKCSVGNKSPMKTTKPQKTSGESRM
jgi:hypothetical protein